jgi:hypothetical protein
MDRFAIAAVLAVFGWQSVSLAQATSPSLMPQNTSMRAASGDQEARIHCLPILASADIECLMTTSSLSVRTMLAPTERERREMASTLARREAEYRSTHVGRHGADAARSHLRAACTYATPAADASPARRAAIEGGYARATMFAAWRDATCRAAETCDETSCVEEFLRTTRQHATLVETIPENTCVVTASQISMRFSPAGTETWQRVERNACGVESTATLERVSAPGRDASLEDERPSWKLTLVRHQSGPIPRDGFCQAEAPSTPIVMSTQFLNSDIAVMCDRVEFVNAAPERFREHVMEGFVSRPEWMTRRDQACDPRAREPARDASDAARMAARDEHERCVARFTRDEARRRRQLSATRP